MEPEVTNRIAEIFKATKTVCVGRFVLEVPDESEVVYGPARLPYLIERLPGKGETFDQAVNGRLAEVMLDDRHRARGPLARADSMFGKVLNGSASDQRIVFGAAKSSGNLYDIQSIQRVGKDLYVQKATAYGDDYREVVAKLNLVAPRLRARMDSEAPPLPGICLDGAFLLEFSSLTSEAIALGVRLRAFPDVHFSIEMIKKDRVVDGDSLEERAAAAEELNRREGAGEWYDRVKIFRRGSRKIANWSGTEFLTRKPAIGDAMESNEFAFYAHGEPGNAMVPAVDIALDTGVKGNKASAMRASITDDEALYLWDMLTSSIRLRRVAGPDATPRKGAFPARSHDSNGMMQRKP